MTARELATFDVMLRGVRVRYTDVGAREAPPVLLLHGLGRTRDQWSSTIEALRGRHRVIAPDLPGFGGSDAPSTARYEYSFESLAETAVDLVAALSLGRVAIVGHSMGAAAGLVLATDRPEFVERLVLVSPYCQRSTRPLDERLVSMPIGGAALFRRLFGPTVLRRHRAEQRGHGDALYAMLRKTADVSTLEARLRRLRTPTMVVWGRDDRVFPWTHAPRFARDIPSARLEILDCGHAPELERASAFEALLFAFLADRDPGLARDARYAPTSRSGPLSR